MADTRKKGYLTQAWLVVLLAVGYGAALAGVHLALKDEIAENKRRDTLGRIPELVPGAEKGEGARVAGKLVYRAVDAEGRQVGWVVPASGQGYNDRIELLIGLDPKALRLTGLYVLDQKETPGMGNKITDRELFLDQFAGLRLDKPVEVYQYDPASSIHAISGATVSSQAVCDIINGAVEQLGEALRSAARTPATQPATQKE